MRIKIQSAVLFLCTGDVSYVLYKGLIFRAHPFHPCDGFTSIKEGGRGGGLAVRSKILSRAIYCTLKVHKHEFFFFTFFAETETILSHGPVTRDFLKSYSKWQRYSIFSYFRACSACDEIGS